MKKLGKELSSFSVDTVVSTQEILFGFDAAGINIDSVSSVQRRASNNTWVVAFKSPEAKNAALGVSSVSIAGCTVFLGDCENRLQIVKIYEAPPEMPDTVIIGRLFRYGKVFFFVATKWPTIYNGIRTTRMRVNKIIPSSLYIAGEPFRIWYPTQPKMFCRCCAEDHLVKQCRSVRCFNCETPGHMSDECPSPPLCSIFLEEDHAAISCPFLLFSANVDENPGNASYADVARTMTGKTDGASSYASVASRSPEQVEAIKAARVASGSGPASRTPAKTADSDKKQPKPTPKHSQKPSSQKSFKSSKSQQQKEKEGESDSGGECERERSKRDRDRDRDKQVKRKNRSRR